MLNTKGKWTKQWPTTDDNGKWFVVRTSEKTKFVEIRIEKRNQEIYLAEPCNLGIQKTSYGTMLRLYKNFPIEFYGPIDMPEDYRNN